MDPDAALAEIREIIARTYTPDVGVRIFDRISGDGARLAELVEALDEWVSEGGFLPKAWTQHRPVELGF